MDIFWTTKGGAKSSSVRDSTSVNVKVDRSDYKVVKTSFEESEVNKKRREFEPEKSGRPNSLSNDKLRELMKLYYSHPYSYRELADIFGVSRMTVWRAVQTAAVFQL